MTSPDPKVIELLVALKNMTTDRGASEAEAATAMAKMQRLLFQHNLSMSDVEVNKDSDKRGIIDVWEQAYRRANTKPGSGFKERSKNLPPYERQWRIELACAIARYNFCTGLVGGEWSSVFFIGSETNIAAVKEIWYFAIEQIDRLSYEALKARRKNHAQRAAEGQESGKTWRAAWLNGCVQRITSRLFEGWNALQNESKNATALVVSNRDDLNAYINNRWAHPENGDETKKQKKAKPLKDHSVYGHGTSHGREAGDRVNLNPRAAKIEGGN